ncbi:MAG: DUF3500 domain-containing protein [Caldilineaceae bacterium]|nr:DUF3500 domain-containing protein [Caldilineaceae bacterium]
MHTHQPTGNAARELVQRMGEAANNFLAALSTDQRAKAQLDFADELERTAWHYFPILRKGLPLGEMDRPQERLAQRLLATGLSREGWVTTTTIMGLERTLDGIEGWTAMPDWWRDANFYFVTIFGQPDGKQPWGWRFDGHHVCLNYTIVDGQIVAPTPTFFGSNPADSDLLGKYSIRPLAGIEDLARQLIHDLSAEQRAIAMLSPKAPNDIVTLNRPYTVDKSIPAPMDGVDDPPSVRAQYPAIERAMATQGLTLADFAPLRYTEQAKGIAVTSMNNAQREILMALIGDYIKRMPEELAAIEMGKLEAQGLDNLHFAWAGGLERRQPHYYRIQAPRFLVEYDNTQNGANHIHSVWRDPLDDFGANLIAQHYASSDHH